MFFLIQNLHDIIFCIIYLYINFNIISIYNKYICILTDKLEGQGLGIIRTKISLDREDRKALLVPLIVKDSGSPPMSATNTLTIIVGDVNDNNMKSASKLVYVYSVKVGSAKD